MKNEIILYQSDELPEHIEVRLGDDTVWLSLNQIAQLFNRDKSVNLIRKQLLQKKQQFKLKRVERWKEKLNTIVLMLLFLWVIELIPNKVQNSGLTLLAKRARDVSA